MKMVTAIAVKIKHMKKIISALRSVKKIEHLKCDIAKTSLILKRVEI